MATYYLKHYGYVSNEPYLSHHGIQGQRWGVKNGPPYPLSIKKHNKVVKRALKNKTHGTAYVNFNDPTYKAVPSHYTDSLKIRSSTDAYTIGNMNPLVNPNIFSSNNTIDTYLQRCNPYYNKVAGARNNCAKCAATMSLMKMGYNHIQSGLSDTPLKLACEDEWFSDAKIEVSDNYTDIFKEIENTAPGSFGTLSLGRTDSAGNRVSGHSMSWTKLRDGSYRIEDGQSGKTYDSGSSLISDQGFSNGTSSTFCDLTNATPRWGALERDGVFSIENNNNFKYSGSFGDLEPGMRKWSI